MPELRKDPILNRWVIIAEERGKRPSDFLVEEARVESGFCPFCPGNESTTPNEVLAYGRENWQSSNNSGWQLRVVPNKYPALVIEGNLDKQGEGMYDRMNGIGAHEVIIETPHHDLQFAEMSPQDMLQTFRAYKERIIDLAKDSRFNYVMAFKNFGKAAGASLEHSHSQLVALPILPRIIVLEIEGSLSYFRYKDRCVFCDIIHQEMEQNTRLVCQNELFVALVPYAPRTPFEVWVLPRNHNSSYIDQNEDSLAALVTIFSEVMRRLNGCIAKIPYNFVLHTQPLRSASLEHYHWHFEIVPKLTSIAGFEWGTGFYINPMPPENSCKYLREVVL